EHPIHIQGSANIGTQASGSEATGVKIEQLTARDVYILISNAVQQQARFVVLTGILSFLGAVLVNIATSQLPQRLQPYLWVTWPLATLVTVVSIARFGDTAEGFLTWL